MSETVDYYGYTLKLNHSDKTGRWHGTVQLHKQFAGTQRQQGTTRAHLLRQLQAVTDSYIKHQVLLRERERTAARLKLDPVRLGKFLQSMTSDNDGEALNAARALMAALKRCEVSPEMAAARLAKE